MKKAGILGGGQLGRMLLQAAANYPVETYVMESDPECPAAHLCHHFVQGDITSYEDVMRFGKMVDVLTIEIEKVNEQALFDLKHQGVRIIPDPECIHIIRNKIRQKEFLKKHEIPTAEFVITENRNTVHQYSNMLPAVHKLAEDGYDGRGVQILDTPDHIENAFDAPAVLEKKVDLDKELSVLIAADVSGNVTFYPLVEMVFDNRLNLLNHQISPARIDNNTAWKAEALALACVKALNSPGLFAVELFCDSKGNVLVNEIAPRVHNSGHHTIEGNYSSQFDMLCRIMLEFPLGNTEPILPAAMVNLVGAEGFSGKPVYKGLENVLEMENVFVHIYGKNKTSPGRKMGHVTIISSEYNELIYKVSEIKKNLTVEAVLPHM